MNTPSITKVEIENRIDNICAYFMELGMEIGNVDNFPISEKAEKAKQQLIQSILESLDRVAQQTREETIEEIRSYIKPLADMEAALREMDKLTSQEKKEECRCQGHSSVYPLSRHAINCPMFEKGKEK